MRVGLDGIPLASPKTGIGHYTFELAHALARIAPTDEFQLISPVAMTALTKDDAGDLPLNLQAVKAKKRLSWWALGLPTYGNKNQLELFHGTNYEIPLWGGFPKILTIHDVSVLLHGETHTGANVRRARRRLPLMVKAATMIITATESVKREICEHLRVEPDKVAVTPYAARSQFRPTSSQQAAEVKKRLGVEDEFVLFVGTIEPRKNLITLVKAFAELLRTTDLQPQLVIAGRKGWLTEELFSYVATSQVKDRILFLGYVSDTDLTALYSSCKAFVYPSLYEGFGLPPLEAMACGAPVISSRIPTIMETVGAAAKLVAPQDVHGLAESLTELLKDENQRRQLSALGLQRSQEFTWEGTARSTLEVYNEALSMASHKKS
jgi:glycosyltransferase involved in cell wall biosynthesis